MDPRFEEMRSRLDRIVATSTRPHSRMIADELVDCWEKMLAQNIEAWDFAHRLVELAELVMAHFDSLDELRKFGRDLQRKGQRIEQAVDRHHPPKW